MDNLVGYESDEQENSSPGPSNHQTGANSKGNTISDEKASKLQAEWDSFEQMLTADSAGSGDANSVPAVVPPPETASTSQPKHKEFRKKSEEHSESESEEESGSESETHSEEASSSEEEASSEDEGKKSEKHSNSHKRKHRHKDEHGKRVRKDSAKSESSESHESEESGSSDGGDDNESTVKTKDAEPNGSSRVEAALEEHKEEGTKGTAVASSPQAEPKAKRSGSKDRRSRSKDRGHRDRKRQSRDRRHSRSSRRRRSRSRHRHRSRSHSKGRRPHGHQRPSPSRRRRRSRSGSRSRRHRHRRPRSHRHRNHSRERKRRSRSKSPIKKKDEDKKPRNFKEMMKQQILQAQKGGAIDSLSKPVSVTLPTSGSLNMVTLSGSGERVTPQQALLQTMAAMHQKAQEVTGVAVPKYYNPAAVNPMKYAEQVQKRKLLWSKGKDNAEKTTTQWKATAFTGDQTGTQAEKFRKLMGIHKPAGSEGAGPSTEAGPSQEEDLSKLTEEQKRKQEELFHHLDNQYEFARMATHTHRGIGLGFASYGQPDLPSQTQPQPSSSTQQAQQSQKK